MNQFKLPDLGEGLQEAEIIAWHVGPGDRVVADQPLVSVETDKAVIEIPAPVSGRIDKLLAGPGDVVAVGAAIAVIDEDGRQDSGAIVGVLETSSDELKPEPPEPVVDPDRSTSIRAVPAARKRAMELDVDLASLAGTGPDQTITVFDVENARASNQEGFTLRGPRRAMAAAMAASGAVVVPATITETARIDHWHGNHSVMSRLIRAMVAACRAKPELNAHFDGNRLNQQERIDIAIAVDTAAGLFTPVLRDAAALEDPGPAIEELRRKVEDRTIEAEEMRNATITLSNFGPLGGKFAALVVTPPQVAILGAGRIREACVVEDGEIRAGKVLPLSLTFDHRIVTGGEAARFLNAVCDSLEG